MTTLRYLHEREGHTLGIIIGVTGVASLIILSIYLLRRTFAMNHDPGSLIADRRRLRILNYNMYIIRRMQVGISPLRRNAIELESRKRLILQNIIQKKVIFNDAGTEGNDDHDYTSMYNEYNEKFTDQSQHVEKTCKKLDIRVRNILEMHNFVHSSIKGEVAEESEHSLSSPKQCPVCCEDYKVDDDVAWSKNNLCSHAFHVECIVHWLLYNDGCPMCRAEYLGNSEIPVELNVDSNQ